MTTTETAPRRRLGDGWMTKSAQDMGMTKSAQDMVQIARFAGFDMEQLIRRCAVAPSRGDLINEGTVQRIMGEMWDEVPHA